MTSLQEIARKYVLKNAFEYGTANVGAVVGKVIAEFPDAKNDMKTTMTCISNTIIEVSKLSKNQILNEMNRYEYIKKEEKQKTIELPNAKKGMVITRFPPEPSGYPHIGHAKAAFLDYEIAKQYDGQMILRFDDTNPEKESQEYVDAIKDGLSWLGIKWSIETYTSDNIQKIYEAAEKLIIIDKAYVCICSQEKLSAKRTHAKPCTCRSNSTVDNNARWKKMLSGKLKAVLLYKDDLNSNNTVMRDPALARVITKKHYRQKSKYIVWPSYDLAVVIMDHYEGITHPMRSKEYELRDALYYSLFDSLKWEKPTMIPFSRLSIKNAPISKRLLTPLVKEKKVCGCDDPRLPTLAGLKRRGILPEAIKNFVLSFGLSRVESEPTLEALLAENRKLIDPVAKRFFFVKNPVPMSVNNLEKQQIVVRTHPKQDLGNRKIDVDGNIYISESDATELKKNEELRLKDLCNIRIIKLSDGKMADAIRTDDKTVEKKIQWVPKKSIKCEILIPKDLLKDDGTFDQNSLEKAIGLCEPACANIREGEIIQFERFGFCRLDKKSAGRLTFIYTC